MATHQDNLAVVSAAMLVTTLEVAKMVVTVDIRLADRATGLSLALGLVVIHLVAEVMQKPMEDINTDENKQ